MTARVHISQAHPVEQLARCINATLCASKGRHQWHPLLQDAMSLNGISSNRWRAAAA